MRSPLDHWFVAEILPHEAALTRYLKRVWRDPGEVADLRQETYVRIYASATKALPTSPKALLFITARNLMADIIRRERIVSIAYTQDIDSLNVLIDEVSPEQRTNARQELQRLSDALDRLPKNCRDVLWLRRVEGLSQRDAAERLGMQVGTLTSYLSRSIRALTKAILEQQPVEPDTSTTQEHDPTQAHGTHRHE